MQECTNVQTAFHTRTSTVSLHSCILAFLHSCISPVITRPQQLGLLIILFVFVVYVLLRVR